MSKSITACKLRQHWINRQEIALLDVREEGSYADSHPLFALSVPVSEIEKKLPPLVPRLSTPIVVYDDGGAMSIGLQRGYQPWDIGTLPS